MNLHSKPASKQLINLDQQKEGTRVREIPKYSESIAESSGATSCKSQQEKITQQENTLKNKRMKKNKGCERFFH